MTAQMNDGAPFTAIDRRATTETIADQLRQRIVDGSLPPGSQLGEVMLSEQLGVSRGPVREAMQRLIQEGLLRSEPYRGVFVIELDDGDRADLYLARAAIERAAALEVVRRSDITAIDRLAELVAKMSAVASRTRRAAGRLAELDLTFHEQLVAASGSRRLTRMYGTLLAETRICLAALDREYPDLSAVVGEHDELVAALRAGRPTRVLAAVDEHLMQSKARRTRPQ
jgi:DNA-binding GntR family transcriptional regulator